MRPGALPKRQRVPEDKAVRNALLRAVSQRVQRFALVPPLTLEELRGHAQEVLGAAGSNPDFLDFTTVLVGNETWRDTFAGIPFDRRVLLLPQCLRNRRECRGILDGIGLICQGCGHCAIDSFQREAEALGYVVLVAEGTTVVTTLLEQGRVDAVVGVSCLDVLERAFPHTAAHAIPSLAFPLYRDGCRDTDFDQDWLRETLRLRAAARWPGRVDIDQLRLEVESWFQLGRLRDLLGGSDTVTEAEALAWLVQGGKRWRPFLTACAYQTLAGGDPASPLPEAVRKVAVATECFHKASLLHDDLEDHDDFRYGQPTPGRRLGMPIALNLGDFLIGEGYRLLAESGLPPASQARLFRAATEGHRSLCLGQGAELCHVRQPAELTTAQVLGIFRQKTSPAFEVALRLGAICAGADEAIEQSLKRFSEALGVAFQIRDDLEDWLEPASPKDADAAGASIMVSLACEHADRTVRQRLHQAWRSSSSETEPRDLLREVCLSLQIEEKARQLLDHYRNESIRSLSSLNSSHLKGLLRRLVSRVLGPTTPEPR